MKCRFSPIRQENLDPYKNSDRATWELGMEALSLQEQVNDDIGEDIVDGGEKSDNDSVDGAGLAKPLPHDHNITDNLDTYCPIRKAFLNMPCKILIDNFHAG